MVCIHVFVAVALNQLTHVNGFHFSAFGAANLVGKSVREKEYFILGLVIYLIIRKSLFFFAAMWYPANCLGVAFKLVQLFVA